MADELNFQIPQQGFDSYLYGIIPDDQAVLAGAFGVSMQQVRNIDKVDATQFAKIAYNMESTVGLPLVAGTDIPTDTPLSTAAKIKTALGSGVYGTYTTSNFFGAMSGLPYPWVNIYDKIKQLETDKLRTIYQQLYLAVTWQPATFNVTTETQAIETSPGVYDWQYRITGTTMTSPGGGYTRNGASAPGGDYTFSDGSLASPGGVYLSTNPDTNVDNVPGTYGRMINLVVSNTPGAWVTYQSGQPSPSPTDPGIQYRLPAPPITYSSYPYTGATNSAYGTVGWPGMNSVVQSLIDDANNEIQAITTSSVQNFNASNVLNTLWNITGIALKHEQRARYIAMPPVPVPWDNRVSTYPTSMYVMVDGIPEFAKQTEPHMAAQTLEHISDLFTPGGQSIIAMMRQERNQDRLQEVGIELDNNLADRLSVDLTRQLMSNGVLPGAVEGIESPNGNIYTLPAWPEDTNPVAYWDCAEQTIRLATGLKEGDIDPLLDGNECPIVNPEVPQGEGPIPEPPINIFIVGGPEGVPNPLPPQVNSDYTGTTLKPSTYDINDAINKVIECNCDCWVN